MIDVEPVAKTIDNAARVLADRSAALTRIASSMRSSGDITYAGEALNELSNMMQAVRLDLFATRSIRALQNKE